MASLKGSFGGRWFFWGWKFGIDFKKRTNVSFFFFIGASSDFDDRKMGKFRNKVLRNFFFLNLFDN
jgi:hypothetical protein